ncbi:hypothetical protein, partial [Burkholderia pseudomallei]
SLRVPRRAILLPQDPRRVPRDSAMNHIFPVTSPTAASSRPVEPIDENQYSKRSTSERNIRQRRMPDRFSIEVAWPFFIQCISAIFVASTRTPKPIANSRTHSVLALDGDYYLSLVRTNGINLSNPSFDRIRHHRSQNRQRKRRIMQIFRSGQKINH